MERNGQEVLRWRRCAGLGPDIDGSPTRWDKADEVSTEMKIRQFCFTLVMSLVAASISLSSEDRSAKPGRTCFAWSLSKAATVRKNEQGSANGLTQRSTDADIFGTSK